MCNFPVLLSVYFRYAALSNFPVHFSARFPCANSPCGFIAATLSSHWVSFEGNEINGKKEECYKHVNGRWCNYVGEKIRGVIACITPYPEHGSLLYQRKRKKQMLSTGRSRGKTASTSKIQRDHPDCEEHVKLMRVKGLPPRAMSCVVSLDSPTIAAVLHTRRGFELWEQTVPLRHLSHNALASAQRCGRVRDEIAPR